MLQGIELESHDPDDRYNIYYKNCIYLPLNTFLTTSNKATKKYLFPLYVHWKTQSDNIYNNGKPKKQQIKSPKLNQSSKYSMDTIITFLESYFLDTYVDPVKYDNVNIYDNIVLKFKSHSLQNQSDETLYFKVKDVIGEGNCLFHSTYEAGVYDLSVVPADYIQKLRELTSNGNSTKHFHSVYQLRRFVFDLCEIFYDEDPFFRYFVDTTIMTQGYIFNSDIIGNDDIATEMSRCGNNKKRKFKVCIRNSYSDRQWLDGCMLQTISYMFKTNIYTFSSSGMFHDSIEYINGTLKSFGDPQTMPVLQDGHFSRPDTYVFTWNSPNYFFDTTLLRHKLIGDNKESHALTSNWALNHYVPFERIKPEVALELHNSKQRLIIEYSTEPIPLNQEKSRTYFTKLRIGDFVDNHQRKKMPSTNPSLSNIQTKNNDSTKNSRNLTLQLNDHDNMKESIPTNSTNDEDEIQSERAPVIKFTSFSVVVDGQKMINLSDHHRSIEDDNSIKNIEQTEQSSDNEDSDSEYIEEANCDNELEKEGDDEEVLFDCEDYVDVEKGIKMFDPSPQTNNEDDVQCADTGTKDKEDNHVPDPHVQQIPQVVNDSLTVPLEEKDELLLRMQDEISLLKRQVSKQALEHKSDKAKSDRHIRDLQNQVSDLKEALASSFSTNKKTKDLNDCSGSSSSSYSSSKITQKPRRTDLKGGQKPSFSSLTSNSTMKKSSARKNVGNRDWFEITKTFLEKNNNVIGSQSEIEKFKNSIPKIKHLTPSHVQKTLEKFKRKYRDTTTTSDQVPTKSKRPNRRARFVLLEDAVVKYYTVDHIGEPFSEQKCMEIYNDLKNDYYNNIPDGFQCSNTWVKKIKNLINDRLRE